MIITQTLTLGEITGRTTSTLPNNKIIKEAQRNMCMSASFWGKIKSGKIPYIFKNDELVEANYTETMLSLNKGSGNTVLLDHLLAGTPAGKEEKKEKPLTLRADKIYWATNEEYTDLNEIMKNAAAAERLKQSYLKKIEKFK